MKGYKHLTRDQIDQLPDLYRQKLTVQAVAKALGASAAQVRRNLHQLGIPLNGAKAKAPCYVHADLVRRMAEEGAHPSKIAKAIGSKHQTVTAFLRRHNIPFQLFDQSGANNPSWRGGRMIDKDGYVLIHQPDHPYTNRHGYVREHRLAMERVLGRYLLPTEVVHHGKEGKQCNDPSNLSVYDSNGEHLAETLKGRTPQWTPEGQERIRAGVRAASRRRASNRAG